jgi:hypothetical protein
VLRVTDARALHATLTTAFNSLNLHQMDPEEPEPPQDGPLS